jgi:hypothetical protein
VPRCLVGAGISYHWSLSAKRTNKQHFGEIFNDGGSVIGFPAALRQLDRTAPLVALLLVATVTDAMFLLLPFILHLRSPVRTDITSHSLFEQYELARADFDPGDAVDFWDVINQQDWRIFELVQLGMQSRVHEHGYYAPMDDASLDIRRYIREKVGTVAAAPSD